MRSTATVTGLLSNLDEQLSAFSIDAMVLAVGGLFSTNNFAFAQLTFETPPIYYSESQPNDPVADFVAKIESGGCLNAGLENRLSKFVIDRIGYPGFVSNLGPF